MVETCARASLAATWYTLAVNAVLIKKSTVAELYKLAAQLTVVVDTDGHGRPWPQEIAPQEIDHH
jgi:hypothetical protein